MEGEHGEPELVVPLKNEHYLIALLDPEGFEVVRGHVGILLHLLESISVVSNTVLVDPHHSRLVGILSCDNINAIESEVELLDLVFNEFYLGEDALIIKLGLNILGIYGILEVCKIHVRNVVSLELRLDGGAVCISLGPGLGIQDDGIEFAVLTTDGKLTVGRGGIEEDGVAGIQYLDGIADHDLEGTLDHDIHLLSGMGNELVGGIECFLGIGDRYVEGLGKF